MDIMEMRRINSILLFVALVLSYVQMSLPYQAIPTWAYQVLPTSSHPSTTSSSQQQHVSTSHRFITLPSYLSPHESSSMMTRLFGQPTSSSSSSSARKRYDNGNNNNNNNYKHHRFNNKSLHPSDRVKQANSEGKSYMSNVQSYMHYV